MFVAGRTLWGFRGCLCREGRGGEEAEGYSGDGIEDGEAASGFGRSFYMNSHLAWLGAGRA